MTGNPSALVINATSRKRSAIASVSACGSSSGHVSNASAFPTTVTTARVFTALGDEYRQRILLMFEDGKDLTIKDIVAASPLSPTAVMHHLRVLRDAKVLLAKKQGRSVHLRPNLPVVREAMQRVLDYIDDEFGSEPGRDSSR